MASSSAEAPSWRESDSHHFLDIGRIYTPRRDEMRDAFLDLIPAERDDEFQIVELAPGAGWLSAAILARYSRATVLALDGSETMLDATKQALLPFAGRFDTRLFRLEDRNWRATLPSGLRCVVSSLAIHHLPGVEKRSLFRDLLEHLQPGGGLVIADLTEPSSPWVRRHAGSAWNEEVERQSGDFTGSPAAFDQFVADEWNYYDYPVDEVDFPSTLTEHLDWLREVGYIGVDVPWARAGHAVMCGYRPG